MWYVIAGAVGFLGGCVATLICMSFCIMVGNANREHEEQCEDKEDGIYKG